MSAWLWMLACFGFFGIGWGSAWLECARFYEYLAIPGNTAPEPWTVRLVMKLVDLFERAEKATRP